MITYSSPDTPAWIKDWIKWSVELLIPAWDIIVTMTDNLYPEEPDCMGEAECYYQYLRMVIKLHVSLQDNINGRERVVHEVVHAIFDELGEAAETLITNKTVKKTAWPRYVNAEETTVVNLSRLLVLLRMRELELSKKTS